jgi:hypothetical protein
MTLIENLGVRDNDINIGVGCVCNKGGDTEQDKEKVPLHKLAPH